MPATDESPLYLCLDQGGHASRALVFDAQGTVHARAVAEIATDQPAADRVEHDPEAVVASLVRVAAEAVSVLGAGARHLAAAGLATQRSSIVCWDRENGAALSPVISWQDRRAHAWLSHFASQASEVEAISGLKLSAHYGVSKLRWCLDHLPAVQAARRAGRLAAGPLASFLAFRLLEERPIMIDPANAQRLLLANLNTHAWDSRLLDLFGVPPEILPACVPTRSAFGRLPVGSHAIPFGALTGDQSAALYAFGAPRVDAAYVNLGTGAFVQRFLHEPRRVAGLLTSVVRTHGAHADYTQEGTVNGAGAALAWAASELKLPDLNQQLPDWLARSEPPLLFLNGIGGLGAPFWVPDFSSRFEGAGEPWQQAVAVAESIVFLLMANFERLQTASEPASTLALTGGLAALDGLCQRLSDLTGLPGWRPDEREATARGVAYLLAGDPGDWAAPAGTWFMPAPNPPLAGRYARWRELMELELERFGVSV